MLPEFSPDVVMQRKVLPFLSLDVMSCKQSDFVVMEILKAKSPKYQTISEIISGKWKLLSFMVL